MNEMNHGAFLYFVELQLAVLYNIQSEICKVYSDVLNICAFSLRLGQLFKAENLTGLVCSSQPVLRT